MQRKQFYLQHRGNGLGDARAMTKRRFYMNGFPLLSKTKGNIISDNICDRPEDRKSFYRYLGIDSKNLILHQLSKSKTADI